MIFKKMEALTEIDNMPNWENVSVDELREKVKGGEILDIEEFGDNGMLMIIKDSKGVMRIIDLFADTLNYKPLRLAEHFAKELKKKRIKANTHCKPFHVQAVEIR